MRIIKVLVDELPKWCGDCMFLHEVFCTLDGNRDVGKFSETPPSWCPLILVADLPVTEDGEGWIIEDPDSAWKEV